MQKVNLNNGTAARNQSQHRARQSAHAHPQNGLAQAGDDGWGHSAMPQVHVHVYYACREMLDVGWAGMAGMARRLEAHHLRVAHASQSDSPVLSVGSVVPEACRNHDETVMRLTGLTD